ncbi:UBA/THIF-type NAD/FAD binding protein [Acidimicrobium ferrooxidans DSM 10331]|uniref:UBA/THIF-type NAD/FAD binding protein n=1 Tax=Acidimicrobium ferrooxidans (strain DSM 10331 / JCM 15462 / NBRC 103882 / ICP) TaxID=525909 RepID=C7LZF7_ACIFD|nr:ThiF family adenylyltransferase [Acidimicrobium ferrooxidans]ACU54115.1 UBA/THIF-type NAD/FAD binding protein [Acidimicrobium ferrooxidans DSM 10331]
MATCGEGVNGRRPWAPPARFVADDEEDRRRLADLREQVCIHRTVDAVGELLEELDEFENPRGRSESRAEITARAGVGGDPDCYGTWFYFPWSCELVRYPSVEDLRALRSARNRYLIEAHEQRRLERARIAVFGLSVGSVIVEQLVRVGIGAALLLGDMDRVTLTNLNRIRGSMRHVGMAKLDLIAQFVSEVDPYIEQVHLRGGYDEAADAMLEAFRPDLVIEEVDDVVAKARLRRWAASAQVALMTVGDFGERSVLDVERYDLGPTVPFNGRLSRKTLDRLLKGSLPRAEERRALVRIVGVRNLSVRLIRSANAVGTELGGFVQLGSTAAAGGALASVAARSILLGEPLPSGRYVLSPRRVLRLGRQSGPRDALRVLAELVRAGAAS